MQLQFKCMVAIAAVLTSIWRLPAAEPARPNVLVILSDDQGYCELGSFMDFARVETLGALNLPKLRAIKECTDLNLQ